MALNSAARIASSAAYTAKSTAVTAARIGGTAMHGAAAAAGGAVPSLKNAAQNLRTNQYQGMSRDNTVAKAANSSPTGLIDKSVSNIAKGASDIAKNAVSGAKAGNALSHGQFREAGNIVSGAVRNASQMKSSGNALNTGSNEKTVKNAGKVSRTSAQGTVNSIGLTAAGNDNKAAGKALTPPAQPSALQNKGDKK